jgi:hypothetical protein
VQVRGVRWSDPCIVGALRKRDTALCVREGHKAMQLLSPSAQGGNDGEGRSCGGTAAAGAAEDVGSAGVAAGPGVVVAPRAVIATAWRAQFEVSAHELPRALALDARRVFSEAVASGRLPSDARLVLVPTIQQTRLDILAVNEATAMEKDQCLERFMALAACFCAFLEARGAWADYCDPCSGLPMRSGGNAVWPEIAGLEKTRRFATTNAGMCRVALHPRFGANMYPATMFTTAGAQLILEALSACEREAQAQPPPLPTEAGQGGCAHDGCCSCAQGMPRHPVHAAMLKAMPGGKPEAFYSAKPFCC